MRQQFSEKQTQGPRLGNLREEGQMVMHIKFERCNTFARQYLVQCTKTDLFVQILRFPTVVENFTVTSEKITIFVRNHSWSRATA